MAAQRVLVFHASLLGATLVACSDEASQACSDEDTDSESGSDAIGTSGLTEGTSQPEGTSDTEGTAGICGDGNLDPGEECDDGNLEPGDGCGPDCTAESQSVVNLSTFGSHTCALFEAGTLRCWGLNEDGRLGYGTTATVGDDEPAGGRGDVSVGGRVEQVSAGERATCALLDDGTVRCWGSARQGLLGQGNEDDIGDDELPDSVGAVPLGASAMRVEVGGSHACALLEGGDVRCWGNHADGRLGLAESAQSPVGDDELPTDVPTLDLGGVVVDLDVGQNYSCAILEGGSLRCWGYGAFGALGYGSTEHVGDDEHPASMPAVDLGGRSVVRIAVGVRHTCAIVEGGELWCWGQSAHGAVGYPGVGPIGDDESPGSVGPVDVGGVVTDVAVNASHTCAVLEDGAVQCWGAFFDGILGGENTESVGDDETPSSVPPVDVGANATAIVTGTLHTCALTEAGRVRCWGLGDGGVLGYGNTVTIGDDEPPSSAGDVPVWP